MLFHILSALVSVAAPADTPIVPITEEQVIAYMQTEESIETCAAIHEDVAVMTEFFISEMGDTYDARTVAEIYAQMAVDSTAAVLADQSGPEYAYTVEAEDRIEDFLEECIDYGPRA